ncbi:hypothetical protein [Patulibacter americanus]|uniref:hypothetical protein n=1 Tax=Patulibacter americanus TaxID=588672 RepID=UPI0003B485E8|nr:hypothetical protein [Patulibacter americanus]
MADANGYQEPATSPRNEHLADRITEEIVQLLYVVRQDLCELGHPDPDLAAGARCRTSQAIAGLFEVAEELRGCPAGIPRHAEHEDVRRRALAGRTAAQIRLDDALALCRDPRPSTVRSGALGAVLPDPRARRAGAGRAQPGRASRGSTAASANTAA